MPTKISQANFSGLMTTIKWPVKIYINLVL
jgi:hypothetical protein